MVPVQTLPEADAAYTPVFKRGRAESVRTSQAAQRLGPEAVRLLQRGAIDNFNYLARCKRSAILWDWIHGVPIDQLERTYSTTPFAGSIGHGDICRFADVTRFHLRSAHEIAEIVYPGESPSETGVDALLRQLEAGIPAPALPLLEISVTLTRGEYLTLYQAGISNREELWQREKNEIASLLGAGRANQLDVLRPIDQAAA